MNDLFISYQWDSQDIVHKVSELLESKHEYKIWIDKKQMKLGDNVYTEIENGIQNSKIFVAFITKKYCESDNCKMEIKFTNSLRDHQKKRCIYVILEKNLGTNLDGIGLLIASSLRLNAYENINDTNEILYKHSYDSYVHNIYDVLSKAIAAYLNNEELPKSVIISALIDLNKLIKCPICENYYNLEEQDQENSAKPIVTSCNNVMCYRCINANKVKASTQENEAFLCPYDHFEHKVASCTNAKRFIDIIRYFEVRESVGIIKNDKLKYEHKLKSIADEIISKVNDTKQAIKEHIDSVIKELNDSSFKMFKKLDDYVDNWKKEQESNEKSSMIDDAIKINESLIAELENDLKQIEIAVANNNLIYNSISKLKQNVDENLSKIDSQILKLSNDMKDLSGSVYGGKLLIYKKGNKIDNVENVIGELQIRDLDECTIKTENNEDRTTVNTQQKGPSSDIQINNTIFSRIYKMFANSKKTESTGKSKKDGRIKCVFVGDGGVGKTTLMLSYVKNSFPKEYIPTVFDSYHTKMLLGKREVDLDLYDTAGQEDYDRLRPLSYPETDVFVICYKITSASSYENVITKWYPEVKHHNTNKAPIILLATLLDLRDNPDEIRLNEEQVKYSEGEKLMTEIKAVKFLECSAKTRYGVDKLFDAIIKVSHN